MLHPPDPKDFAFTYPIWVCGRKGHEHQLLSGSLAGGGRFVAVFTDGDLAERFAVASGKADEVEPVAIPDAAAFADALRGMLSDGLTHIVVDGTGKLGLAPTAFAIPAVLDSLADAPGKDDG